MSEKMLICTVGLPRSGKSAWAKKQDCPIVNPDSVRLALHGQRYRKESEPMVWAITKTMIRALFLAGHDKVILDATCITREQREQWICDEWNVFFHQITTSKEECIKRARLGFDREIIPIIEHMSDVFDPLVKDEKIYGETWETREGKQIQIKDMTDAHIVNTIRCLEKYANDKYFDALSAAASATTSGEIASYYAEQECYTVFKDGPELFFPEIYYSLQNEAGIRRLEI